MSSIVIIRLLKTSILLGLCLIVTGHGLIVSSYFTNQFGIKGIITAAACIAIGVLLSLPTKIYLTILLGSVDLCGLIFVQTRGDLIAARGL